MPHALAAGFAGRHRLRIAALALCGLALLAGCSTPRITSAAPSPPSPRVVERDLGSDESALRPSAGCAQR